MICVDIGGGVNSQDHVARYMLAIDEALQMAATELNGGYLVNLRSDSTWGPEVNFDSRLEVL